MQVTSHVLIGGSRRGARHGCVGKVLLSSTADCTLYHDMRVAVTGSVVGQLYRLLSQEDQPDPKYRMLCC